MNLEKKRKFNRGQLLLEKLTNFFRWIMLQDYVKGNPRSLSNIKTTAEVMLATTPEGFLLNYQSFVEYVERWIIPAHERVKLNGSKYRLQLKLTQLPEERVNELPEGKFKGMITWRDWVLYQNLLYWGIEEAVVPKEDVAFFLVYLNFFAEIIGPDINRENPTEENNKNKEEYDTLKKKIKLEHPINSEEKN